MSERVPVADPRPALPGLRLRAVLRDAAWLHQQRVVAWATVLLATETAILLFLAAWQHGWIGPGAATTSSDFVSFYAAGKLALSGAPALAYDRAAHFAAEQATMPAGAPYQFFFYPPVFLLLCAPLALLPYPLAYAVFELVTAAAFLLTLRAVLCAGGWRWVVPALACPAVFWTVGVGQNAFLTAALFAGFTLLVDRRPATAGLLLAGLCYKPHFGLLAPVALAAAGRWRAFAAAAAGVTALLALSAALFGWGTWHAYLLGMVSSGEMYASGRIQFAGMVTPFGAMRLMGFGTAPTYAVQAASTLAAAGLVALVWRWRAGLPVRAAVLLSGTLLAAPLALLYDQMLWLLAAAWLVRIGCEGGFLPWEKLTLAACFPAMLLTWPLAHTLHLPLGPPVAAAVLALAVRRSWRERVPRPASAPAARKSAAAVA